MTAGFSAYRKDKLSDIKLPKPGKEKAEEVEFGPLKFKPTSEEFGGTQDKDSNDALDSIKKAIESDVFENLDEEKDNDA